MGLDNIYGKTVLRSRENSLTGLKTVRGNGGDRRSTSQIHMKGITLMTRKTALAFSPGRVGTFIEGSLRMTREKGRGK